MLKAAVDWINGRQLPDCL